MRIAEQNSTIQYSDSRSWRSPLWSTRTADIAEQIGDVANSARRWFGIIELTPPARAANRCGVVTSDVDKASFTKETDSGKIVPLEVFSRPIPDLWFPLGSGTVAYPFGRGHRVTSDVTQPGSDDAAGEDLIDVCGEIYIGTKAPLLSVSTTLVPDPYR